MNKKMWIMIITTVSLVACSQFENIYPDKNIGDDSPTWGNQEKTGLFGGNGINLFGGDKNNEEANINIGVNAFLWRASLDTLAFMPLISADPFGGVIITDWYTTPKSQNERFKLSVFITDRILRADALRISVFRQEKVSSGEWVDSDVSQEIKIDIENAILTRAREMRSSGSFVNKN
ncbi:MAG: DUF3576 domain-containing protein [Rhodospirillaceae bacterium]|nr:DUF3576 domain-containing protein [Rhodospirillaceae bacterium]